MINFQASKLVVYLNVGANLSLYLMQARLAHRRCVAVGKVGFLLKGKVTFFWVDRRENGNERIGPFSLHFYLMIDS